MAMEIFKLIGSIFVNSDAADESLQKTDSKAKGVGETLSSGIKTAAKWGTAIVGGATAAVTGITAFASKSASAADEIDKMSQRLGLSRQAYQELDFAMSQSGVDVNSFQTGMKSLLKNMDAVTEGSKTATENFKKIGVSVTDSKGKMKDQETVLWETIRAFQKMEEGSEKSRLAQELFGKQGQEIMPMLNDTVGGIEEMRKKAQDLGLVLGDDVIDSGVKLTDTMDQMKRSAEAVFVNLGGSLMPIVQKVAEYLLSAIPKIEQIIKQIEPIINQMFLEMVPPLLDLAEKIFPEIVQIMSVLMPIVSDLMSKLMPIVTQVLGMILPPIVQIVEQLLPPLLMMLSPILDLLSPILDLLSPVIQLVVSLLAPLTDLINNLLTPLIAVATEIIKFILPVVEERLEFVSEILSGTFRTAIDLVMNSVKTIKNVFSGLIQFLKGVFTGDWKSAWEGVKKIFSSIWEGIKSVFKIPINWIIDGINAFIRGINKIKIPDWVPLVGGKGFNIGEIPNLASGAVLEKGQTGFLEGNGAEAVVPLENNRKWISAVARDMDSAVGGVSGKRVEAKLEDILAVLEKILGMEIYLDTGSLVGGLADPMDKKLGQIAARKVRV